MIATCRLAKTPLLEKHILIHIFEMLISGSESVNLDPSKLSSLDKEESRPKPGRWFDLIAVRFTALFRRNHPCLIASNGDQTVPSLRKEGSCYSRKNVYKDMLK